MQYRALSVLLGFVIAATTICSAQFQDYRNDHRNDPQNLLHPAFAGMLVAADGLPLNNIRIEVRQLGTGAIVGTTYSQINGTFDLPNVRMGQYEVVAVNGVDETHERVDVNGAPANVTLRMPGRASAPSSSSSRATVSVAEMRTPEKARRLVEKARMDMAKGRLDDAQKHVAEALAIAPEYSDALTMRAAMKLQENQMQAAVDDLDHAIKADPSYSQAYLVLGATYNHMGRYDEALRTLDRSAMYDPKSWQCSLEMAKAWLGKGDYAHAMQQLNKAESLGAMKLAGTMHLMKGYALMGQKQFEQAAAELQAYLTAEPQGELAGSVRMALAKMKTDMAQSPAAVTLPAMTGFFAQTQH
jgi:Tfp pilus assembly protein PilF